MVFQSIRQQPWKSSNEVAEEEAAEIVRAEVRSSFLLGHRGQLRTERDEGLWTWTWHAWAAWGMTVWHWNGLWDTEIRILFGFQHCWQDFFGMFHLWNPLKSRGRTCRIPWRRGSKQSKRRQRQVDVGKVGWETISRFRGDQQRHHEKNHKKPTHLHLVWIFDLHHNLHEKFVRSTKRPTQGQKMIYSKFCRRRSWDGSLELTRFEPFESPGVSVTHDTCHHMPFFNL